MLRWPLLTVSFKKGGSLALAVRNGIENQNYTANRSGTWQVPLILLIDHESASASEILAGAINDNRRGLLIGSTSYGKGSVQGLFHTKTLASGIRLTVSKFYSPTGAAISERGVQPTIPVEMDVPSERIAAKPVLGGDGASLMPTGCPIGQSSSSRYRTSSLAWLNRPSESKLICSLGPFVQSEISEASQAGQLFCKA